MLTPGCFQSVSRMAMGGPEDDLHTYAYIYIYTFTCA